MTDAPGISNVPDPIAMMAAVDVGTTTLSKDSPGIKSFDDMINGIIHSVGDKVMSHAMSAATAVAGAAMAVTDKVTSMASAATSYNPNFTLPGKSSSVEGPAMGKERSQSIAPEAPSRTQELAHNVSEASLGQMVAPATPSQGVRQSQGISI